jgi:SAM-dependent methyltransferase
MNDQANEKQITYWNDAAGPKWVDMRPMLDRQLLPFGAAALEAARIPPGARVLDVGCGCGATTRTLGGTVGPSGSVVGVDVSEVMLETARAEARAAGLTNVTFLRADAQTHPFPPASFDRLYSRFGVMFFADPTAAFANLLKALVPGGRLAFICWQPLAENAWCRLPLEAAAPHLTLDPPHDPNAPGPFAFGDRTRLARFLTSAGYLHVRCEDLRITMDVGGGLSLDDAVAVLLRLGPLGTALTTADPAVVPLIAKGTRERIAQFETAQGVRIPAAAWVVSAERPS